MALSGNKGEWSEIYTLFKLLGDKQVYAGDADMNKIPDLFYPIIKILRSEINGNFEYEVNQESNIIIVSTNDTNILKIPIPEFQKQALNLLHTIKESTGASFSVAETEKFMYSIKCKQLKAKSQDKADIRIIIHDLRTHTTPLLGFSIKSKLGKPSTLFNAGVTTNFIYEIKNTQLSNEDILRINSIKDKSKIKSRISEIERLGGKLVFMGTERAELNNNLILIDSLLPKIIGEALKIYFSTDKKTIKDITDILEATNPMKYDNHNNQKFYDYKIKHLLTDIALGMTAANIWNGKYDATGGYLVVKENGDIVCYHIYNKNDFENYLFYNTRFETASSTRYHFGIIENTNGKQIFRLNLQIRFI